jgi:hypothetical protein
MATESGPPAVILTVGIELLGVGLLTILAGASDEAGKIVILFMLGLWLIWMISDSAGIAKIGNVFNNVASMAA